MIIELNGYDDPRNLTCWMSKKDDSQLEAQNDVVLRSLILEMAMQV